MRALAVVTLVLAMAAVANAAVYSWEGTNDGWNLAGGTVSTNNLATIGVTDGSYSVEIVTAATAQQWSLVQLTRSPLPTELGVMKTVLFDVTTNNTDVWVDMMAQGGSPWYASADVPAVNCSSDGTALKTTTASFTFADYPDAGVSTWNEIRIQIRGNNSADPWPSKTLYLDNFRVVPEPVTMALLGVGSVGMLIRRKR